MSVTTLRFTVNGEERSVTTDPERPLLDVLREDLGLTGTKYGCGEGRCGACAVLLDGKRSLSCLVKVGSVAGRSVTTIEDLAKNGALHPVQEAFLAEGSFQCGYCAPGVILTTIALLERNPDPTDEEIAKVLNGNLCRCCNYPKILNGVRRAAKQLREEKKR